MSVPDDISITREGPDTQGRLRAYTWSGGKQIGAATAVPDPQVPGTWVISDMHFLTDGYWPDLGHALLNALVELIEHSSALGTKAVITGSLDNLRFRDAIDAYGPRIAYQRG